MSVEESAGMMSSMFGDSSDEEDTRREAVVQAVARAKVLQNDSKPYAKVGKVNVGGGRGILATQDLPAGTLVVSEIPVMPFEDSSQMDDPVFLMRAIKDICADELAVDWANFMYPQKLTEADSEEQERVREIWGMHQLESLSQEVKVPVNELIRRVLAVQHNGFNTGIYKWLAMMNHSCAPNCMKFAPSNSSFWASEIWTTRAVKEGEELTMCYQTPMEMTHRVLQNFLTSHHRFTCTCQLCSVSKLQQQQTIFQSAQAASISAAMAETTDQLHEQSSAPSTTQPLAGTDEDIDTEKTLAAIQEDIESMEKEQRWSGIDSTEETVRTSAKMLKACIIIQSRCLAALKRADDENALGNEVLAPFLISADAFSYAHLRFLNADTADTEADSNQRRRDALAANRSALMLLVRAHKVIITASVAILDLANNLAVESGGKKRIKKRKIAHSLLNYLVQSLKLRELQIWYLGVDHPDLATTNLDIAQGLSGVLDLYGSATSSDVDAVASAQENTLESLAQFTQALEAAQVRFLTKATSDGKETNLSYRSGAKTSTFSVKSLRKLEQLHRREGDRVKDLYGTRKKFPEAFEVLNSRGAVYWGRPAISAQNPNTRV